MSFEIKIKKKAFEFLSVLKEKGEIRKLLLLLKDNPVPVKSMDVSKLKGMKNVYRIRVGKIRIVYEVNWSEKLILIHRASFRKGAYSHLREGK